MLVCQQLKAVCVGVVLLSILTLLVSMQVWAARSSGFAGTPTRQCLTCGCVSLCFLCNLGICRATGWLCKYCIASGLHLACASCCILAMCTLVSSALSLELAILLPDMSCGRRNPGLPSMPAASLFTFVHGIGLSSRLHLGDVAPLSLTMSQRK